MWQFAGAPELAETAPASGVLGRVRQRPCAHLGRGRRHHRPDHDLADQPAPRHLSAPRDRTICVGMPRSLAARNSAAVMSVSSTSSLTTVPSCSRRTTTNSTPRNGGSRPGHDTEEASFPLTYPGGLCPMRQASGYTEVFPRPGQRRGSLSPGMRGAGASKPRATAGASEAGARSPGASRASMMLSTSSSSIARSGPVLPR